MNNKKHLTWHTPDTPQKGPDIDSNLFLDTLYKNEQFIAGIMHNPQKPNVYSPGRLPLYVSLKFTPGYSRFVGKTGTPLNVIA